MASSPELGRPTSARSQCVSIPDEGRGLLNRAQENPTAYPRSLVTHLRGIVTLWLGLVPIVQGCGVEAPSGPKVEVRDSAGIVIAENRGAPPMDSGWKIDPEPALVIGSMEGPEGEQLYEVRGALRLPDGRIAVATDGSQEIRIFDSGGSLESRFGGDGEGPGEFRAVMLAGLLGDSLVVLDRRLKRISLVHPDEGFVRSFPLADGVAAFPMEAWAFGTGSVLIQDLPPVGSEAFQDGFHRTPIPVRSVDMMGRLHTDFGSFPGDEMVTVNRQTERGMATMMTSLPFGKSPQVAVKGDWVYLGSQDEFQVQIFRSDGTLERIVRLDRKAVPVTDADLEAYIDEEVASLGDEGAAPGYRRQLEEMPRSESFPAHGGLVVDAEGFLFVEEFALPGEVQKAINVFDPQGRLVGGFEIPAKLQVLEIGADYLLALYEDEVGLEYLELYSLDRPG